MKTFMPSADIPLAVPALAIKFTAVIAALTIVAVAFASPSNVLAINAYSATIRMIGATAAIGGSLCLASAIGRTLLRSYGAAAFKASYIAAASLSGLGLAEALSALRPANIGLALVAYCIITIVSGALWWRFYDLAA